MLTALQTNSSHCGMKSATHNVYKRRYVMKAAKVQQVAFCSTVFKVLLQNQ